MIVLILASLGLLSFLLLLDLNELRVNNIEHLSISTLLDENTMIMERIDSKVKPYLKKVVKIVHHQTNIPYEYEKSKFNDMTSFQVISDFTTETNITSAGDFMSLLRNFVVEDLSIESETNDQDDDNEFGIQSFGHNIEKIYNIILDLFRDKYTMEINTTRIYETI